jgi:hypothetical protein
MKNYIVTITKSLGEKSKVEVEANSKKEIIEKSKTQFGLGIAPFNENDIVLKSDLQFFQQKFYYDKVNIFEPYFIY